MTAIDHTPGRGGASDIDPSTDPDLDVEDGDAGAGLRSRSRTAGRPAAGTSGRVVHRWTRWIHVYTSMIAFLVVLFFGVTGITLNHPTWTFGDEVDASQVTGTLPVDTTLDDGSVNFLAVSEYVRQTYDVGGHIDSFEVTNGQGSIAYKRAGYAADLLFDVSSGSFELNVEQQGWVAVLNDLHKGRDTGGSWRWVIDLSAGFLVVVSLTGLLMQFFLRKRRRSAYISALVGGVAVIALALYTLS